MRDADRVRDLVISGIRAVNKRGILRHAPMPFQTLIDENLTREKLRSMLTELDDHVDQQTTVFFYYKGHGGYSTQPPGSAKDHTLFLQGVDRPELKVTREELLTWLAEKKHPRLVVLITDTCSLRLRGHPRNSISGVPTRPWYSSNSS